MKLHSSSPLCSSQPSLILSSMSGGFSSLRRISYSIRSLSLAFRTAPARARKFSAAPTLKANIFPAEDVEQRLDELDTATGQLYPRIGSHREAISCRTFEEQYEKLVKGESRPKEHVVIHGMLRETAVASISGLYYQEGLDQSDLRDQNSSS